MIDATRKWTRTHSLDLTPPSDFRRSSRSTQEQAGPLRPFTCFYVTLGINPNDLAGPVLSGHFQIEFAPRRRTN